MILTNAAPPEQLGAANGLSQTTASIMRALAPAIFSTLFAISVEHKLLGGFLVYVIALFVSMFGVLATRFL